MWDLREFSFFGRTPLFFTVVHDLLYLFIQVPGITVVTDGGGASVSRKRREIDDAGAQTEIAEAQSTDPVTDALRVSVYQYKAHLELTKLGSVLRVLCRQPSSNILEDRDNTKLKMFVSKQVALVHMIIQRH